MTRPTCAAFVGTSLDGFIARSDGRLDWLERYQVPPEVTGYTAFFDSVDTLLVGRSTWETVADFPEWPYAGKRVVVLTRRPLPALHGESTLAGTPAEVLARLEALGARRVYVDGGAVVSQFLAAGLLDELTVTVVPLVLGDGIRLLQGPLPSRGLTLVSCRAQPLGLVQLAYRVG
jgi:dihydrofolate reductase